MTTRIKRAVGYGEDGRIEVVGRSSHFRYLRFRVFILVQAFDLAFVDAFSIQMFVIIIDIEEFTRPYRKLISSKYLPEIFSLKWFPSIGCHAKTTTNPRDESRKRPRTLKFDMEVRDTTR
jgi:hypothetical protein